MSKGSKKKKNPTNPSQGSRRDSFHNSKSTHRVESEFILPKPKPKKKVAKEPEGQKLFDELVALGLPTRTGELRQELEKRGKDVKGKDQRTLRKELLKLVKKNQMQ